MIYHKIARWPFCLLTLTSVVLAALPLAAHSIERPEEVLNKEVGVYTQLGVKVDLSRVFTDRLGERKPLKNFAIADKPILIVPVYYKCPRMCGLILDGVVNLLNQTTLQLGEDFSVLAVSFDPLETASDAGDAWAKFNERLIDDAARGREAFRFLVGSDEDVAGLMRELGFKYLREGKDFAHSAAVMILTPTGEISQYFTGIQFSPWDVRLSLIEASQGKIGSAMDHFLLYCFRFDPLQGKYTWAVEGVLRVGGALTLLGLGLVYFFFARKRPETEPVKAPVKDSTEPSSDGWRDKTGNG
jgi:protein SCO1/2